MPAGTSITVAHRHADDAGRASSRGWWRHDRHARLPLGRRRHGPHRDHRRATSTCATSSSRCCSPRPASASCAPTSAAACWHTVFEPGGPEVAAAAQFLVQASLERELGDVIAIESVEVEAQRRRARRHGRLRRPRNRVARGRRPSARRRGCRHDLLHVRQPAPAARGQAGGHCSTASSSSRSATTTSPSRRCASARSSSVCSLAGAGGARRRTWIVIDGGERIRPVGVEWAMAAADLLPAAEPPTLRRRASTDPRPRARGAHRRGAGDFSRYRFALRRPRHRRPADRLRPAAGRGGLLVQGRVPERLRLPPALHAARRACTTRRRSTTSPRTTRASAALMLERMALLAPEWTERVARRRRRHARRAAGLRRRRAVLPAGRRGHRGLPRTPPAAGSRCAATRGWSTTACTTAATRARWVQVHARRVAAVVSCCRRARGCSRACRTSPTRIAPATRATTQRALAARPVVFETVDDAVLDDDLERAAVLDLGAPRCDPPAGRDVGHPARDAPEAARRRRAGARRDGVTARSRTRRTPIPRRRFAVRLVEVRSSTDPSGHAVPGRRRRRHRDPLARGGRAPGAAVPRGRRHRDGGRVGQHRARRSRRDRVRRRRRPLGAVPFPHGSCARPPTATTRSTRVPARFRPTLRRAPAHARRGPRRGRCCARRR